MKRAILPVFISAYVLSATMAFAELAGSKHDLTRDANTVYTTDSGATCVFCHTPHISAGATPLWAKQQKETPGANQYSLYNWVIPGGKTPADAPSSSSLSCLSCHDGTIGPTIFYPYAFQGPTPNSHGNAYSPRVDRSSKDNFTGDHPVSTLYKSGRAGLASLATAKKNGMAFYGAGGDRIECASCHNPHTTANTFSLERPEGDLCVSCHEGRATGKHVMAGYGFGDDHPVKGKPDPLRKGRDISCTTCHSTHASAEKTLTADEKPSPMCLKCHKK
jgi:predicted CXXCH cytochrome family protein